MKHFLTISCIFVGAMICPFGQGEVSTSIIWEIDGPDEPRTPATHLLDLDGLRMLCVEDIVPNQMVMQASASLGTSS